MRPHLCDRFIFLTGYRGNRKATDFITSVNGTVLITPFHVDDLLEIFAFVELRTHLLAAQIRASPTRCGGVPGSARVSP